MVAHLYDTHIYKTEEEDHCEFKANLGYRTKTCLKRQKKIKVKKKKIN